MSSKNKDATQTIKQSQQDSVEKIRQLITHNLSVPPKDQQTSTFEACHKEGFERASPNNLYALARLLSLPTNHDFITALYVFFLKRAPDPRGMKETLTLLNQNKLTRPKIALIFATSAEAKTATKTQPNTALLMPLLFTSNLLLLLPFIGNILRLVWRLATLNTTLQELELLVRDVETETSNLVMQRDDRAEYEKNRQHKA